MTFSRDLGFLDTDEVAGMAKMATVTGNAIPEKDAELLPALIATAKAGVAAMGGHAHVFIGGGVRRSPDPNDAPEMDGIVQRSFTIIITTHTTSQSQKP